MRLLNHNDSSSLLLQSILWCEDVSLLHVECYRRCVTSDLCGEFLQILQYSLEWSRSRRLNPISLWSLLLYQILVEFLEVLVRMCACVCVSFGTLGVTSIASEVLMRIRLSERTSVVWSKSHRNCHQFDVSTLLERCNCMWK